MRPSNRVRQEQNSDQSLYYIGVMSGTSADGIDVALISIFNNAEKKVSINDKTSSNQPAQCQLIKASLYPLSQQIKSAISQLSVARQSMDNNQLPISRPVDQIDQIDQLGKLDQQLGVAFAEAVNQFIAEHQIDRRSISAIGCHGQTIRHRPTQDHPFSFQIGDPNIIAHLTSITTVADFRRMDIAAGGQGAPLVPAFHQSMMQSELENRIILNLGGIANITLLPKSLHQKVIGFDTGPANTLLDAHFQHHFPGQYFDCDGQFAQQGTVNHSLLNLLLKDPYFALPPPKSSGREYFHLAWLDDHIARLNETISAPSIQATLMALTAVSISDAINNLKLGEFEVYACGGGMHNRFLVDAIGKGVGQTIYTTNDIGVDGDYLEAMTFGWLAHRRLQKQPGNMPQVTGASSEKILGAIYHP